MDRMNFNSYDHFHYYNQTYQADGQHTFQPETGQTSGGRAASGASWNQPTPGQPQPYQNFNFPEHIPPLHGSDWEYSQQFPQSNASENTIGSEVLLSPPNAQPAVHNFNFPEYIPPLHGSDWEYSQQSPQSNASENTIGNEVPLSPFNAQPAVQNFDFPEYIPSLHEAGREYSQQSPQSSASGNSIESEVPLSPSNAQSAVQNFDFPSYIPPLPRSDWEYLQPNALENIIGNEVPLSPSNVQPAVEEPQRKQTIKARFLAGLNAYASGAPLENCSSSLRFRNYIKGNGDLTLAGRGLLKQLTDEEKTFLNQAISARQEVEPAKIPAEKRFLAGLDNYAGGVALVHCSATLAFKDCVTDGGDLKPYGKVLRARLSPADQQRVNDALLSRRQFDLNRTIAKAPVEERFLAGLDNYAQGLPLKNCSATLKYNIYVTDDGYLRQDGKDVFNRLSLGDQERVNDALLSRRQFDFNRVMTNPALEERFLAGLASYAQGAPLGHCSTALRYNLYASDDGKLPPDGERLYNRLSPEDQNRVDQALAARRKVSAERIAGDLPHFMKALESYSDGVDFLEFGKQSGLKKKRERYQKVERYLTPEGGLTPKGELLIENLSPDEQIYVKGKVEQRRQLMNPSAQAPESPWQMPEIPASMPEMGGMDLAAMADPMQTETMVDPMQTEAMVDPMQTEAMWATAWQMTGQAVPGTRGMPSYDNEAFGADFQYHYGPYADQYSGRG
jgi:hypothetical protein